MSDDNMILGEKITFDRNIQPSKKLIDSSLLIVNAVNSRSVIAWPTCVWLLFMKVNCFQSSVPNRIDEHLVRMLSTVYMQWLSRCISRNSRVLLIVLSKEEDRPVSFVIYLKRDVIQLS
jgi:hypothetical protein